MPIADRDYLINMCGKAEIEIKTQDTCETVSKKLVQLYLQEMIEKVVMYVMQFSTSNSFIKILNENFIDLRWDLIKFSMSNQEPARLS